VWLAQAFFVFSYAAPAMAQSPTASIDGTITDASNAIIVDASVVAENVETSVRRTVETDGRGRYLIESLEPGEYRLEVSSRGFDPGVTRAVLRVGDHATVNFALQLEGVSERVDVTQTSSGLNTSDFSVSGSIGRDQIEKLPLNGRHVLDLARLEPGVGVEAVVTPGSFGNNFVRVSVAGASFMQTRVSVDGSTIDDRINGGTMQNFSQESIQEFQVSRFNFDLTTGPSGSGSVNVVSRRGGNQFDGSAFLFYRDDRMAAYPALTRDPSNPEPQFARRQFGFSVGGPLRRDRIFWFANMERNDQDGVVATSNNHPIFSALDVVHPTPLDMSLFNVRLDARVSSAHTGFMRVSADRNSSVAPSATTPRDMPSHWLASDTIAVQGVFGVTSVLSQKLLNDLRLSYGYLDNRLAAVGPAECSRQPACMGLGGPEILIFDAPSVRIGHHPTVPKTMRPATLQLVDTVSWQHGAHNTRLGGEWEHLRLESTHAFYDQPQLVLWGPTDLLRSVALRPLYDALPESLKTPSAGPPTVEDILQLPLRSFTLGVGDPRQPGPYHRGQVSRTDFVRAFAQDSWTPRHDLTVTYGATYSYRTDIFNQDLPRPDYLVPVLDGDLRPPYRGTHTLDPSVGLAWTLGEDGKTVIRGGTGRYRDELHFFRPFLERGFVGPAGNGRVMVDGSLAGYSFLSAPTAFTGADLIPLVPGIRADLTARLGDGSNPDVTGVEVLKQGDRIFAPDHTTAYAIHATAGIQRELTPRTVVTADYVMRRYAHLGGFHHQFQLDRNRFNRPRVLGVDPTTGVVSFVRDPIIPLCTRDQAAALDPRDRCSTGPINVYESRATSRYQGLHVRLDSRLRAGIQLTGAYAWATHAGFVEFTEYDVSQSAHGNIADHRQHRLTASAVFEMPRYRGASPVLRSMLDSWTVAVISQIESAPALGTMLAGLDLDGDGISRTLLPGTRHNTLGRGLDDDDLRRLVDEYNAAVEERTQRTVGPGGSVTVVRPRTPFNQIVDPIVLPSQFSNGDTFITQDVRVTKVIGLGSGLRLSLSGEVFNLFNVANLTGYSNILNQPNYGQPSARAGQVFGPGGPRAVQLAMRLDF
jgi:hypothetical protein